MNTHLIWCRATFGIDVVVVLGFTTFLTSQVISITFYIEHGKSDKFGSEAIILA